MLIKNCDFLVQNLHKMVFKNSSSEIEQLEKSYFFSRSWL